MAQQDFPTTRGSPHGRPSSWALVIVTIVAFAGGGAALILGAWTAFYVCAAAFALCIPAAGVLHLMDDTVSWTSPQPPRRRASTSE